MATNYFYDTEFLEDGETIELISIGMVSSDGREYYAVNQDCNWDRVRRDPWLMENVMSSIAHNDGDIGYFEVLDEDMKPKAQIAKEVKAFILEGYAPQLWAWFGAYDHVALAQLFGKMIHLPDGIPMWTNDIKTLQFLTRGRGWPQQEAGVHNALADARHNKVKFDYLWGLLTQ
jgi:hypothetical protein